MMAKQGGKRHGGEQIVRKLRDAEALLSSGKTIGEACQVLDVSEQTFHRWRKKYGGMKSLLHRCGNELRAVVAPHALRHPTRRKQFRRDVDRVLGLDAPRHMQRQTLACELIHHRQALQRSSVRRPIVNEVPRPCSR